MGDIHYLETTQLLEIFYAGKYINWKKNQKVKLKFDPKLKVSILKKPTLYTKKTHTETPEGILEV